VVVRDATPADVATIADVHIRTWQSAYAHVFPAEKLAALDARRPQRERFWRGALESPRPRSHTSVAERKGHVVGFASIGPAANDESLGELYSIYVLPEEWGRGAGAALMVEALEQLRRQDFETAILWVIEDNPRARAFYERHGWRLEGEPFEERHLDTRVREVGYRISLRSSR
jgi:ribosomal protein S18 acetylase RimI-like enzyme